jgi:hypothetical protein
MSGSDVSDAARAALAAGESVTNTVLDHFAPASMPAGVFDLLNFDADAVDGVTVIGGPGELLRDAPRAGDLLVERVRGERDTGRVTVLGAGGGLPNWAEASVGGQRVRVPQDSMVLRPEVDFSRPTFEAAEPESDSADVWWEGERWPELLVDAELDAASASAAVAACVPAPEPDPSGRGPHPLILVGSHRPTVGYAQ